MDIVVPNSEVDELVRQIEEKSNLVLGSKTFADKNRTRLVFIDRKQVTEAANDNKRLLVE